MKIIETEERKKNEPRRRKKN